MSDSRCSVCSPDYDPTWGGGRADPRGEPIVLYNCATCSPEGPASLCCLHTVACNDDVPEVRVCVGCSIGMDTRVPSLDWINAKLLELIVMWMDEDAQEVGTQMSCGEGEGMALGFEAWVKERFSRAVWFTVRAFDISNEGFEFGNSFESCLVEYASSPEAAAREKRAREESSDSDEGPPSKQSRLLGGTDVTPAPDKVPRDVVQRVDPGPESHSLRTVEDLAAALGVDAGTLNRVLRLQRTQLKRSSRAEQNICRGSFCPGRGAGCEDCAECLGMSTVDQASEETKSVLNLL